MRTTQRIGAIYGRVGATGAPATGINYTCSKLITGQYMVRFASPFRDWPAIAVAVETAGAGWAAVDSVSPSQCAVKTYNSAGVATDLVFNFTATGQLA